MSEIRALAYADWRTFVNDLKSAWRSRGRLVVWLLYGVGTIGFILSRTLPVGRYGYGHSGGAHADLLRADFFICAQVALFAFSLAFGSGRIGLFRTLAEARFVVGSAVRAPVAIAYLQARDSLASALRSLSQVVFIGFAAAPRHLAPFVTIADILFFGAMFGATRTVLLARNLAPRPWPAICLAAGIPLGLVAMEPAVRDVAGWLAPYQPLAARTRDVLPAFHPGIALLAPTPLFLIVPLAILAATIALVARGGRDAYPELYALSLARIDNAAYLAERRNRKGDAKPGRRAIAVALPAPSGSLVILWKSVVEFRRAHPTLWTLLFGAAIWIAVGFAFARLSPAFEPFTVVSVSATVTIFVMSMFDRARGGASPAALLALRSIGARATGCARVGTQLARGVDARARVGRSRRRRRRSVLSARVGRCASGARRVHGNHRVRRLRRSAERGSTRRTGRPTTFVRFVCFTYARHRSRDVRHDLRRAARRRDDRHVAALRIRCSRRVRGMANKRSRRSPRGVGAASRRSTGRFTSG
jgi:hypothetical protein